MVVSVEIRRVQHKPGLLQKLGRMFTEPKSVKVGFPAGTDSQVLKVAVFNHFGTRGSGKGFKTARGGGFGGPIPERPFLSAAMRDNHGKYRREMQGAARKILVGDLEKTTALSRLGILAQGDIQKSILSWTSPPNSPTTIRLKGTNAPLRDTGRLHASVWYELD